MRHPSQMRDEILSGIVQCLERLRIRVGMYLGDETDALRKLERPQQMELAVEVTNLLMTELGHVETAPKDPRFDKTRRALAKKLEKPLRGERCATMLETFNERRKARQETDDGTTES